MLLGERRLASCFAGLCLGDGLLLFRVRFDEFVGGVLGAQRVVFTGERRVYAIEELVLYGPGVAVVVGPAREGGWVVDDAVDVVEEFSVGVVASVPVGEADVVGALEVGFEFASVVGEDEL